MKRTFTDYQIIEACPRVFSFTGVCRELGLSPKGGNINTIKKYILKLKIDTSHFTGQLWNKGLTSKNNTSIKCKPISEILVINSGWSNTYIKNKLYNAGLKGKFCECCKLNIWNDYPIPL